MKKPAIYILANKNNSTLYIGVTSNLLQRIYQHKNHHIEGFTKKYNVEKLVYYEIFADMDVAIEREKQLKNWKRAWKDELVESMNPRWVDLWDDVVG
ncbi:MAG: GIY-YIG nuclease family protein [Desulfuromonadaceae bacterium]